MIKSLYWCALFVPNFKILIVFACTDTALVFASSELDRTGQICCCIALFLVARINVYRNIVSIATQMVFGVFKSLLAAFTLSKNLLDLPAFDDGVEDPGIIINQNGQQDPEVDIFLDALENPANGELEDWDFQDALDPDWVLSVSRIESQKGYL
ncbi:unnamed protein product [Allacma fusca]|uniref:Uncharacterized protein n=1 Tax=Allacma fusca TaxID=39272 RepID=A0A8J2JQM9_9HEXA|nr:unnamed protein product [Allacma fusca]